ncbi:hypothetical protein BgAZ_105390 [Babesia gibsoni]
MMLVRVVLFFPVAFSLVRATGEGQAGGVAAPAVNVEEVPHKTFRQQLDFVKNVGDVLAFREQENKEKLLKDFPLLGKPPFPGAWDDLKAVVKDVTELRALLVKGQVGAAGTDVGKTLVNVLDIFLGAVTDAANVADRAVKTVAGMDSAAPTTFNVTPEVALAFFGFLPELYETLKDLQKKVVEWAGLKSTFGEERLVTKTGDHRAKYHLGKAGFGDDALKVDTTLEELQAKLDTLVGKDKPFEKVLCALAGHALMRDPKDTPAKQGWVLLLSQAMGNEAMKAKVKKAVNDVTGKGEAFVDQLEKVGPQLRLAKEEVPQQYRFPGVYADLDVQHFWTVLNGVFGTLPGELTKAAAAAAAAHNGGEAGPGPNILMLVKPYAALQNLAAQLKEVEKDGEHAEVHAEAAAAAATAKDGKAKEGQGEDGAQFTGVFMAMFCVSVAVDVF